MNKEICMIAHRGYSGKYHENTEQAFVEAVKNGSGGAETDVRVTKDGKFILCHNDDAVFIDGSKMKISDYSFDELTAKPLLNKRTDDEVYLCTFERYLEIMKENNMVCFIELKGSFTDEQIKGIYETISEIYDLKKCIIQSFDFDNLLRSREYIPDLPIMLTYGKGEIDQGYERCFEGNFSIDMDYNLVSEEVIKEFHKRGLQVGLWTVNDEKDLEYCKTLDVDYIESDYFGA